MIICYPIIDGKKTEKKFFENWDEVPMFTFVKWQKIANELEAFEDEIKELQGELIDCHENAILAKYNSDAKTESKNRSRMESLKLSIESLEKKYNSMIVDGVACFCDIPIPVLLSMPTDSPLHIDSDNHLNSYIARLFSLASTPLPTGEQSSFYFQTETDETIEALEKEYKKLGTLKILSKSGIALKNKIRSAKCGLYKLQDIWLQSTYVNKEFVDMANKIVEQMKVGDFSGLIYLIAMLTVEGNSESEILQKISNEENSKGYLEKYRIEFRKIYKKREEIFTKSKVPLTVGTVMRIKNFFLRS